MNYHSIRRLLYIVILFYVCSCSFPNGISIGKVDDYGQKTITLDFSNVALKFDFSETINTAFVNSDYGQFITAHNVIDQDWSKLSGTINSLSNILWDAESYDDSHRPSITVTVEDMFMGKTEHKCKKEDISGNTIFGIPNVSSFYQGTVEIKSIKTQDHGVLVVWSKSALKDYWPINEYVKNGKVTCEVTSILKVGTNNDNGNVAARGNTIISNTSDNTIIFNDHFIIEDKPLFSPALCKPVLVNGEISDTVTWSEPVIYKPI